MMLARVQRRLLHAARCVGAAGSTNTTTTSDLLSIFSATEDATTLTSSPPQQRSGSRSKQSKCRLAPTNPVEHGMADANSFFIVDRRDEPVVSDVFLKRRRRDEVRQQGFCSFLLRQSTMKVASIIDAQKDKAALPQVFLIGKDGHGKSTALAYLSYRYWKEGWVVLPVSSGARWVLEPHYIDMSTYKPGRVDSTRDAITWLNSFFKLNSDRIADLKTTKKYTWLEGSHTTAVGTPLKELLSLIEEDDRSSADIVGVIVKELLAAKDRPNVLLAVDDMNGLFEPETSVLDENFKPVNPEDMSLVRTFRKVFRNHSSLDRVGIVAATSTYSGVLADLNDETRTMLNMSHRLSSSTPSAAAASSDGDGDGDEEAVVVDDARTVPSSLATSAYKIAYGIASDVEVTSFLDYHNSIGWCNMPSNAKTAKLLQSLSAGNLALLSNHLRAC
ncbi:hypothetical protein PTSG_00334 [Salpingoeca rosetta]|uniref:Small ribosomal subunit protein mS29 n=1 Tax=Salpingoeca rosetta (strain ATCC 50818 / BSB-021) TaxID=946362 RepID=F2TW70_SALR5|nr:uncharacterized protein PTSG_00334 [Salpingoeca rosetta]EGD72316.1 hypothetical protein PTSG_00334 [Salpingoeca rosetta]|eukprot:XP_004998886.1 hypothetical protein PTSG_00334 [Salpingoeca rosetta]